VRVTVLATTDLHGNIYPIDYFTGEPANRGLARIATLVRAARAANPNSLLIDCGDTIQGTPLESVHQAEVRKRQAGAPPDPMMLVMNELGYDAMTLGNHEFNFGLANLQRARDAARFPWLSANTKPTAQSSPRPFAPYLLKEIAGVKVAVIGVTTPSVPFWESPPNYAGYRFVTPRAAIEEALAELRPQRPDLVIVSAHSGLGGGWSGEAPDENNMRQIAETVPGVDAIVFGHTHQEVAELRIGNVLLAQPKNWGGSLAELDFTLEPKPEGGYRLTGKHSRVIPVTKDTAADERILTLARPYHEAAERWLNTPVARSEADLDGRNGRLEDSALVDAIQRVQLQAARADVSFTSLFNTRARIDKGPVTVRQIAGLYIYENELYAIEGDGRMVKEALENAARYYLPCESANCATAATPDPNVIGYNYDMAEGVEYEIDLRRPPGERIRNLRRSGKPLDPGEKLRLAVNNYRAGGSAGYTMFRGAKILWRSGQDIRQLLIDYYTQTGQIPATATNNWHILP
jgi:2',3'-cyclic-nucleotide 2'-phosphodiesterase / 3'-nucleotidase